MSVDMTRPLTNSSCAPSFHSLARLPKQRTKRRASRSRPRPLGLIGTWKVQSAQSASTSGRTSGKNRKTSRAGTTQSQVTLTNPTPSRCQFITTIIISSNSTPIINTEELINIKCLSSVYANFSTIDVLETRGGKRPVGYSCHEQGQPSSWLTAVFHNSTREGHQVTNNSQ